MQALETTTNRGLPDSIPHAITVTLLWHCVDSANLGIGALTVSHLAIIEKVALTLGIPVRFRVVGWRGGGACCIERPDLEVVAIGARDLLRPGGVYAAARQSDVVLDVSTGDAFADIYGTRRFAANAIAKAVVLAAGRPLVMSPQTIGPFERGWVRFVAGLLMRRARTVVTRDRLSTEFLDGFGLGAQLVEATDLAFRLPYEAPDDRRDGPSRIGLNVSGLLFNGGYTRDNMFGLAANYPDLVRRVVRHFVARSDCELHLIGHVNSGAMPVEDDYRVARQLVEKHPGAILAPRFDDPSRAKSYIAGMDFFCGSRMHACIAAFSSGVPVLPIAYSRKFAGVFGSLGYEEIADCKTQSAEDILAMVVDCYERRGELKGAVEAGRRRAEIRLAAYEAVLRETLVDTIEGKRFASGSLRTADAATEVPQGLVQQGAIRMVSQKIKDVCKRSHVVHSTYKMVRDRREIAQRRGNIRDIYNIWRVYPKTMLPPSRLFNIFDSVRYVNAQGIPGDLVECGVWSGGSAAAMALADLDAGRSDRRYVLFDSFQGLPQPSSADREVAGSFVKNHPDMMLRDIDDQPWAATGTCVGDGQADVESFLIRRIGLPKDRLKLYAGWFHDTIPVARGEITSIAILRLDGDLYESTRVCLEGLYHRVEPGGFVIIDDYGEFSGCRKAVDDFLHQQGVQVPMEWVDRHCVYFRKPAVAARELTGCATLEA